MTRLFAATLFALSTVTPVMAQDLDLQTARSAIMGQLDLLAAGIEDVLASGTTDLDPARYQMEYAAAMLAAIPWLFPEPTETTPQDEFSNAAPAIWQDFDGFMALTEHSKTAAEDAAFSDDAEGFRAGFTAMQTACAACHDGYVTSDY